MYHPYENGYSVLPQLRKLGDRPIFEFTPDDQEFFLEEKEKAVESQICFGEHYMLPEIYDDVCKFIVDNYPIELEEPHTFDHLAMQIQEDIAIHRLAKDVDWLAAAFICFPSLWRIEDKIGRDFNEIHAPVPKMKLTKTREMLEACIEKGPFERFVWSPVFDPKRINYHPRTAKKKFDKENPCIHCKVERQVIIGFPKHNALLFTMRQHIVPQEELNLEAMYDALNDMGMELEKYNGIFADFFSLKNWLKEEAGITVGFQTTSTKPQQQPQQQRIGFCGPSQQQSLQNGKTMRDGKVVDPDAGVDDNTSDDDPDSYYPFSDWSGIM